MARYLILDLIFLLPLLIIFGFRRKSAPATRSLAATLGVLLLLTAVFDNVIIGLDVVHYNNLHIIGLRLLHMPIEDFAYTAAAAMLIPMLWSLHDD